MLSDLKCWAFSKLCSWFKLSDPWCITYFWRWT